MVGGVKFDEEKDGFRVRPIDPPKGFYKFFIQNGFAKNNEEAGKIMAMIAVGAILIAVLYPFIFG
jgi:hypothetical protein